MILLTLSPWCDHHSLLHIQPSTWPVFHLGLCVGSFGNEEVVKEGKDVLADVPQLLLHLLPVLLGLQEQCEKVFFGGSIDTLWWEGSSPWPASSRRPRSSARSSWSPSTSCGEHPPHSRRMQSLKLLEIFAKSKPWRRQRASSSPRWTAPLPSRWLPSWRRPCRHTYRVVLFTY